MSARDPRTPASEDFPATLRFRHAWRPYQERVLEEFERYLRDDRFHVVAAPGAGKTVLGLEVLRRLGVPALVLAPTLVVREQWANRLVRDFLDGGGAEPPWLSRELGRPGAVTVSTYQALASAMREQGDGVVSQRLAAAGVRVLLVDEAHHLRAHWWRCLEKLRAAIAQPRVVALTATPPWDVPAAEWNRYASFCGEIDEEVGIPELVRAGSLCPHQDLVYFSAPSAEEEAEVRRFEDRVGRVLRDLECDTALAAALALHPRFGGEPDRRHLEDNPEYYLAAAAFLTRAGGRLPPRLAGELGLEGVELPRLDRRWHRHLLQGLVLDDAGAFAGDPVLEPALARYRQRLHDVGAVERGALVLDTTRANAALLRRSRGKLMSVCDIVSLESREQGEGLRAAVLTDFIRDAEFPDRAEEERVQTKLGVVPLFEMIRRLRLPGVRPAVLTGKLLVIPQAVAAEFARRAGAGGEVGFTPLAHDPAYLRVPVGEGERSRAVAALTQLFDEGEVNTLVATAALLGEGWDAPCLNTLVLASAIGTFVSSNQMRGRAIRVDPRAPGKTANIWHLACLGGGDEEPGRGAPEPEHDGAPVPGSGDDLATLERRFRGFAGLDLEGEPPAIQDGLERLGIRGVPGRHEIPRLNARMCAAAAGREEMALRWRTALGEPGAREARPIREVRLPSTRIDTRLRVRRAGGLSPGAAPPGWWGRLRGRWRRRRLERRLRGMARAVLEALRDAGELRGRLGPGDIEVRVTGEALSVGLPGASNAAQARFAAAMAQLFDLLTPARYLIRCGGRWYRVPDLLAAKRAQAERLSRALRRHVGRNRLVYVRSPETRRLAFEARRTALLDPMEYTTETRVRWRRPDGEP